ncbi:MAG: division/cell wall cluster transcriptional repressor MraZ [Treponema sp.]|jgi:MraZ protein|nr:division/cell wall cluster transcriptional repressor MraZ [Treponema sp.]
MKLSGEFIVILDEKNRITLPAQIRKELDTSSMILTKGEDNCLWLYTSAKWEELVSNPLKEYTDPFSKIDRRLMRKFVGPSQTVEIDKAGRILIPDSLFEYAKLTKDCIVLGQLEYIEVWEKKRYYEYCNEDNEGNANDFDAASEELSRRIKRKKGITD